MKQKVNGHQVWKVMACSRQTLQFVRHHRVIVSRNARHQGLLAKQLKQTQTADSGRAPFNVDKTDIHVHVESINL
jgi:hypothetical protein